jgi:hypothetical protein
MTQSKVFLGGVPTEPEVNRLISAYQRPAPGLIPYEEIEAITNVNRVRAYVEHGTLIREGGHRFTSVLNAWRARLLRDYNVVTEALPDMGIVVLKESEKSTYAAKKFLWAGRRVKHAHTVVQRIDDTQLATDADRRRAEHMRLSLAKTMTVMREETTSIRAALRPPVQNPRRLVALQTTS